MHCYDRNHAIKVQDVFPLVLDVHISHLEEVSETRCILFVSFHDILTFVDVLCLLVLAVMWGDTAVTKEWQNGMNRRQDARLLSYVKECCCLQCWKYVVVS